MIERLILVRHAETVDNARGLAQGWSDSALSTLGEQQVDSVAKRLVVLKPTSMFCSTLPRALTTAEGIADQLQIPARPMDEFREVNYGNWEGRSLVDIAGSEPELFARWSADPNVSCPSGESFAQTAERLNNGLELIRNNPAAGPRPLIVFHGTAIRIAATVLLSLPLSASRRLAQDNTGVNIFDWRSDRFVLRSWNDTSHFVVTS